MAFLPANPVVANALSAARVRNDGWGTVGAAAFLAGMETSDALRKKNEDRRRRATGEIGHAVRDLRGSLSILDALAQTGGTVNGYPADVAMKAVRDSANILSRLFGV